MSFAAELHQAHKERLARIDRAAAHRKACARAAHEIAKTAELEKYLSNISKAKPHAKPIGIWFGFADDDLSGETRKVSVGEIQRAACNHFGITPLEIIARRRARRVVIPRQVAMYLCKTLTTRSLPEIGRMFGGMDHTTVLHAVRITEKRSREDWRVAYDIAHVEGRLV